VVISANRPALKGYVEIEFTAPAGDFWGIHPTVEPPTARPSPAPTSIFPDRGANPTNPAPLPPSLVTPARHEHVISSGPSGRAPSFEDIPGLVGSSPQTPAIPSLQQVRPRPSTDVRSELPMVTVKSFNDSAVAPLNEVPLPSSDSAAPSGPGVVAKPLVTPTHIFQNNGLQVSSTSFPMASPPTPNRKLPMIVGAATVLALLAGAGFFYMHRSNTAQVDGPNIGQKEQFSPPAAQATPQRAQTEIAASVVNPPPNPASELSPAALAPASAGALNDSVAQVRPAPTSGSANQPSNANSKETSKPAPARQTISNLKIHAPAAPARDPIRAREVAPLSDAEISTFNQVNGTPLGGAISSIAASNKGPAPPRLAIAPAGSVTMQEAKLVTSIQPIYPPAAKQSNIQGDVVLTAKVDSSGKVGEMAVISGPELLRRAATDAVQRWKYQPAMNAGIPVASQVTVRVQFRIR
jgi:TonB family protein